MLSAKQIGAGAPDFLAPRQTNFAPLSPVSFLRRSAIAFGDKPAIVYNDDEWTYREFAEHAAKLAGALKAAGVGRGDVVAAFLMNTPPMLHAHYAIPAIGAILNAINTRLDAETVHFILGHGGAKVLIVDGALLPLARQAISRGDVAPRIVVYRDPADPGPDLADGEEDYQAFLTDADPAPLVSDIADEWAAMCLNYTSGTTGNPKGVLYHHRGGYLNALGNAMIVGLDRDSAYLWTLPMFHCNGWTFTWATTAAGAKHVCLRNVDPAEIYRLIAARGVTHLCGAPVVLNMLLHAPDHLVHPFEQNVRFSTGGAAPPSSVIEGMQARGIEVMHLYGLTETYGPATVCEPQPAWQQMDAKAKARVMARQGIHYPTLEDMDVRDPATGEAVPWDGATIGEITIRGNTVMMGYHDNPLATEDAFRQGWYWTGDLAVRHADGFAEVKDRSKDIIISGGENISSLEIEEVLYRHPGVLEAAVVARPDEKWGEVPCAFVDLKPDVELQETEIVAYCRENMAHFKAPKAVIFGPLPKTSTGKIQKFELRERAKPSQYRSSQ